jgi:hypothetical protein
VTNPQVAGSLVSRQLITVVARGMPWIAFLTLILDQFASTEKRGNHDGL